MSQPSTPFAEDQFLSILGQQQSLSQAELDNLFGSTPSDQAIFSSNNSPAPDEFDFSLGPSANAPLQSSQLSLASTPDLTAYNFDQQSPSYPPPDFVLPQPYPLQHRQACDLFPNTNNTPSRQRPLPGRSRTNIACSQPTALSQGRRRSSSHGDADRIANTNSIANPTFVRLQAPRSKSAIPEERRKGAPYSQHGRSTSQGPGRPLKFTRTLHGVPVSGDVFGTPIGTPLNDFPTDEDTNWLHIQNRRCGNNHGVSTSPSWSDQPTVQRMVDAEQLARSRKILQIGAMAVATPIHQIVPRPGGQTPGSDQKRIFLKLKEIEEYLKKQVGDNSAALRGCAMIREAIYNKVEARMSEALSSMDSLAAPSRVFEEMSHELYNNHDDSNELMDLLMRDAAQNTTDIDEDM
ncbi:hypothetical protein ACN47E_004360 [Coniothyrium glycines]